MLNKNLLLHLSLIDGIGPMTVKAIIENKSDATALDLYNFSVSDWICYYGFTQNVAEKLVTGLQDKKRLETELLLLEKHHIGLITIIDDSYPALLREIYMPPTVLYYRGGNFDLSAETSVKSDKKHVAVVGSRASNAYGYQIVTTLIPDLVAAGATIVSGGALGIDAYAHDTAIKYGGKTIAVLGSGLLKEYPASNKKLFRSIVEHDGIMISIFPLRMEPVSGNFPARNRVIAGLSHGCLVVQAAQKSGALITARYALEQGREVFAVPGAIHDPLSVGCHELIQQGAKLVISAQDIMQEIGGGVCATPATRAIQPVLQATQQQANISFSETQAKIIAACKQAASLEDILALTGLALPIVQAELFDLQLEGVVEQNFTGMWVTIRLF